MDSAYGGLGKFCAGGMGGEGVSLVPAPDVWVKVATNTEVVKSLLNIFLRAVYI